CETRLTDTSQTQNRPPRGSITTEPVVSPLGVAQAPQQVGRVAYRILRELARGRQGWPRETSGVGRRRFQLHAGERSGGTTVQYEASTHRRVAFVEQWSGWRFVCHDHSNGVALCVHLQPA